MYQNDKSASYTLIVSPAFIARYQDALQLTYQQTTYIGFLEDPSYYPSVTHTLYNALHDQPEAVLIDQAREQLYSTYNIQQTNIQLSFRLIAYALIIAMLVYPFLLRDMDRTTKQWNQLLSVGMTRRQLKKMLLGESLIICLVILVFSFLLCYNFQLYDALKVGDWNYLLYLDSTDPLLFLGLTGIILLIILLARCIKIRQIVRMPIRIRYQD